MRFVKGPTAVCNPGASFKIEVIKRSTIVTPVVGCAAKITQPLEVKRDRETQIFPLVQVLCVSVKIKTSALQQPDAKRSPAELPGQSYSCCPGTYDANVGLDKALCERACVD